MWGAAARNGSGPHCAGRSRWREKGAIVLNTCPAIETRKKKKKKGFIAAMRNSGQSPDCGHSNQGCHRLTIIAISGDEQEKFFSLVFLLASWQAR